MRWTREQALWMTCGWCILASFDAKRLDAASHLAGFSQLASLVRSAATSDPAVMMATADSRALVTFLPSLLVSLAACDPTSQLADHLIVIAEGDKAKQLCDSMHKLCWLDHRDILKEKGFSRVGWRKAEVAALAVALGIGTFTIDLDLVFLQNPFNLLQEPELRDLDYFAQPEAPSTEVSFQEGHINIGFQYFAPTPASRDLLSIYQRNQTGWDQEMMKGVLRSQEVASLRWQALDTTRAKSFCHLFPDFMAVIETETFARAAVQHFAAKDLQWEQIVLYHFPCCGGWGGISPGLCKAFLTSLVLDGWLRSQHL